MTPVAIATWDEVEDRTPVGALVAGVDLVIVRYDDEHSVLHGRCQHRGALLADGSVVDGNIVCGLHGWDYCFRTGISEYDNSEQIHRFSSWLDDGSIVVDRDEIEAWVKDNPQPYDRDAYQGAYQDLHGTPDEPHVSDIQSLAANGLEPSGHHGPMTSMGVPGPELPRWDDIQFVTAQLATRPLADDAEVETTTVIGPDASAPLTLDIPIFVSDMSFGALSEEAKTALARGAERAGTGICSGEGGMLPEEHAENSRYFYELASGRFGWSLDKVRDVQAFHFKFGQGAKTGTGGHLPGIKVIDRIATVRDLPEGTAAVSPATFVDLVQPSDYAALAAEVRAAGGGIPIGAKLSAQHIEDDLDAALEIGVDYIILDGRGGGTGAAPKIFRDHISVPTIPALARARRHLDAAGAHRRHAGRHRRAAYGDRLRQGPGPRRRRDRRVQRGHAGHRLSRHAGLQHQQLPGRDRHPAAPPPGAPPRRRCGRSAPTVLRCHGRPHEGAGPSHRPRRTERVPARRPHHVRPGDGPSRPASPTEGSASHDRRGQVPQDGRTGRPAATGGSRP